MPRNPQDEDAAEACTDALRYVEDATQLDQKFSAGWENLLIEGYEGIELTVDEQTGEIGAVDWPWDRLFTIRTHASRTFLTPAILAASSGWTLNKPMRCTQAAKEAIDATTTTTAGARTTTGLSGRSGLPGPSASASRSCKCTTSTAANGIGATSPRAASCPVVLFPSWTVGDDLVPAVHAVGLC